MYYFYLGQNRTALDVLRGKAAKENEVGYDSVLEQEAFIVDDEMEDLDDDEGDAEDEGKGKRRSVG